MKTSMNPNLLWPQLSTGWRIGLTILVGALFFGCVALAMVHSVPLWIKMTAVTAVVVVALAVLFRLAD